MIYYDDFQKECVAIINDIVRLEHANQIKEAKIRTLDLYDLKFEYYTSAIHGVIKHSNAERFYIDRIGSFVNGTGVAGQIKRLEKELYEVFGYIKED